MSRSAARVLVVLLAFGLLLAGDAPLAAAIPQDLILPDSTDWPQPLDRRISLEARRLSLRDALDRVAAAGHFRLSYSGDDLPLDRAVRLSVRDEPAGQALRGLLAGSGVEPTIVGPDHVVLPPPRRAVVPTIDPPIELESIVVTGTADGGSRRPLTLALDVVPGADLRLLGDATLAGALSGAVPGLWLWPQSPASVLAGYGSIRGASSFGLSYPKVYIDGIELANPLLLTRLAPEAVDRIEVIRGPQGAALYGADAISGVMNIVTRQEGADPDASRLRIESGVAAAASDWGTSPALGQRHALTVRLGSNLTSAALHLAGGSDGPFIPGASHQFASAHGTLRRVGERTLWTGLARVAAEAADAPPSPLLPDSTRLPRRLGTTDQSVVGYTLGANLRFLPGERWTHTAAFGLDGYTLSGIADERTPITSAADSALRAAEGNAVRGSLRLGTVRHLALGGRSSAHLTLGAEHSILRQRLSHDSTASTPLWQHTSAASLQGSVGVRDRLYLSGGLRVEGTTGNDPVLVPMVGAATIVESGSLALKLRGAFGKGVRWPTGATRTSLLGRPNQSTLTPTALDPEEQSGFEFGADLMLGGAITLAVTRFDQLATGLIQRVGVATDTVGGPGGGRARVSYHLENIGEINNRGWELGLTARHGPWSVNGALSFVDSRVERLAAGYRGDLQTGDRMLEVPARTMSLTARWEQGGWSAAISAARAEDWVNYDRLGLAAAFAGGRPGRDLVGARLRDFWLEYPGVTRLRAAVTRNLSRHLALTAAGENLLDEQRGEPDNLTVVPGRTVTIGLRGVW